MTTEQEKPEIADESGDKYKYGFVTDIASDTAPKGLSEDIIRLISQKKGEPDWLLERRLEAFRFWQKLKEPTWAKLSYDKIDYQDLYYYSAPKQKVAPKSLDEVDPELLKTYEKLGIPLKEQEVLSGVVAVDAVFDSVSVATTYRAKLAEKGVIFCPISEAIKEYPELVKKYLGSFVPYTDNFAIEPVSFIIAEGVLVSVRNAEFRTFTEAAKRLQMNYRAYTTGYHLLVSILEVRIDYDADLVEALAKNIAVLSKEVSTSEHIDREILKRISHLQENTMLIRENIFDRQRVLSGIQRSERFPNDVYPRLTLMIKDVNSLINHADFSSERLDYLQDTALGLINIEQSNVTKIFTVAALFFMPPTMIASIYGMNFAHIPEVQWTYGYPFALGLMVLVAVLTYLFFRWKKWL